MSELMREALRRYQREREWEQIRAYGTMAAEKAGVKTEEDVVNVIHEFRREQKSSTENHEKNADF